METTEYRDLHQLKGKHRVWVGCVGIYKVGEKEIPCAEIEEVVVENKTLTFDDYINCRIMNLLVKIILAVYLLVIDLRVMMVGMMKRVIKC